MPNEQSNISDFVAGLFVGGCASMLSLWIVLSATDLCSKEAKMPSTHADPRNISQNFLDIEAAFKQIRELRERIERLERELSEKPEKGDTKNG